MQDFELERKHFKNYYHFDNKISYSIENKKKFADIIKNNLINYRFLPFIRSELKLRKLSKIKKYIKNNKTEYNIPDKEKAKIRILTYCSHKDALIFSAYRQILLKKYENFLKENNIDKNVIAYRKIKVSKNSNKCKSNIHFAAEAFYKVIEYTKKYGECVVLTFDISSFFDNIEHKFLHKQLCKILNIDKLTKDWSIIFHNITKFYYVNIKDIENILKDNNIEKDIKNKTFFPHIIDCNGKDLHMEYFRKFILNDNILKKNENGIPQGSPISDVLANIYLNEFDIKLYELEKEYSGFYRRYCDDIIFICKNSFDASKIENVIIEAIEKQTNDKNKKLSIQEAKTTRSYFTLEDEKVVYDTNNTTNQKLKYLGFEFNNKNILIKNSSLSKRLRKIGTFIKGYINDAACKAYKNKENFPDNLKIKKLYNSLIYTKKDKKAKKIKHFSNENNYFDGRSIKYILRARNIFDNLKIDQLSLKYSQIKKTKKYIKSKIEKYTKLCKNRFDKDYYLKQLGNKIQKNSSNKCNENNILFQNQKNLYS